MATNAKSIETQLDLSVNDTMLDEIKKIAQSAGISIDSRTLEIIAKEIEGGFLDSIETDLLIAIMRSHLGFRISTLKFWTFPYEEMMPLLDIISESNSLTALEVGTSNTGPKLEQEHIMPWDFLRKNKTISSLKVIEWDERLESFFPCLENHPTLTELEMRADISSRVDWPNLSTPLSNFLSNNSVLLRLTINDSLLDNSDDNFIKAITHHTSLTYLDISYNELSINNFQELPGLIQKNQTLRTLKLTATVHCSRYAENHEHYEVLQHCILNIGKALESNKTLTVLNTPITFKSAAAFARALELNNSLNTLGSHVGEENEELLYTVLMYSIISNRTLTCLDISPDCLISNESSLIAIFKENKNLIALFGSCDYEERRMMESSHKKEQESMTKIRPYLTRNRTLHTNWTRVALLTRFMIANRQHPFNTSILPLIPTIMGFMHEKFKFEPPTFNMAKLSRFTLTRYFHAQLDTALSLEKLTIMPAVARASDPITPIMISEADAKMASETGLLSQFKQSTSQPTLAFARTTNAVPSTAFAASAASTVTTATTASLLMPPSNITTASISSLSMLSKEGTKHTPANRKRKK